MYLESTKGDKEMNRLLMACYFDGLTVAEAKEWIERVYQEKVTDKAIEKARNTVRTQMNKEWK